MIKLKTISMRNFLSIGNVTQAIHLDDNPLTLVLGNNADSNNGTSRNGAGKSSLLQAISYALYGQPLTKIKMDNLINNINKKGMFVAIDFSVNEKNYRIERGRRPNFLKYYVDGEEVVESDAQGENKETNIDIVRLIGMSHNMFTHIVALNTYTIPFLKQPAAQQRAVTEELLGVTQMSLRAENLKKEIGLTKDRAKEEEAKINAVTEANARIDNAIKAAQEKKKQWDTEHDKQVNDLAYQIEELSTIDFESEKILFDELDSWNANQVSLVSKIEAIQSRKNTIKKDISRLEDELLLCAKYASSSGVITRLEKEISRKEQDVKRLEENLKEQETKKYSLTIEIEGKDSQHCSTCSQALVGTDHLKQVVKNLETKLNKVNDDISSNKSALDTIVSEIEIINVEKNDAISKEQTDAEHNEQKKTDIENQLLVLKEDETKINEELEKAKDASVVDDDKPQPLFTSRDELYTTQSLLSACNDDLNRERNKENPHIQYLETLHDTLQDISYDKFEDLRNLMSHQEFLYKLLTNKDSFIRRKIVEQNLHYLNQRLSHYSEKLGLPHEVTFQSDLSVEIMQLGQDFDYDQLSRGEQLRVILSVSWAFRDVWESLNHGINLLWVDEMLDAGIDSSGAEYGLTVLKSMGRDRNKNVFLISHRDELVGRIDSIMMVSKINGFTNIGEYDGA